MTLPFSYSPDGSCIVSSDGPELLVYDGPSEGPLWRTTQGSDIVAVGATGEQILCLEQSGKLTRFRVKQPTQIEAIELGMLVHGMAIAPDLTCAVWSEASLFLLVPGRPPHAMDLAGISSAAFGPDQLAMGFSSGAVALLDPASARPQERGNLGAPVVGLGYCRIGMWFAAAFDSLHCFEPGGGAPKLYRRFTEERFESLCLSPDGALAAFRMAGQKVGVHAVATHELAAVIQYERAVGEVAFGPAPWLGVGLDKGDANKIDLDSGAVHRTDEHPGRPHNRWVLMADVKPGIAAKARGKAASIAVEVRAERPPVAPALPQPEQLPSEKPVPWHWIAVGIGLILTLLKLLLRH